MARPHRATKEVQKRHLDQADECLSGPQTTTAHGRQTRPSWPRRPPRCRHVHIELNACARPAQLKAVMCAGTAAPISDSIASRILIVSFVLVRLRHAHGQSTTPYGEMSVLCWGIPRNARLYYYPRTARGISSSHRLTSRAASPYLIPPLSTGVWRRNTMK